jgi:general secretion pathway protein K
MISARHCRSQVQQQKGIAIIMVLGLVIFLTVIALSFSDAQRVSTQVTSNALASARAQAAADGAVNRMVFELSRPRSADAQIAVAQWKIDGVVHQWNENGAEIAVSAKSETAKIDLNFASEPLLKRVFTSVGATEEEADAIVACIKDWTDADNLKRPNGAEADDYRAAGKKVLPANDFFIAIEELQNVIGISPKIYSAVAPLLTVQSRSPGIDPQTASLTVLSLVPGVDVAQAQSWVEQRDQALRDGQPVPPLPFSSPYFASGTNAVRVRADVVTASGVRASREASLRLGGVPRGRPQYFLWQRGFSTDAPANMTPAPAAATGVVNG